MEYLSRSEIQDVWCARANDARIAYRRARASRLHAVRRYRHGDLPTMEGWAALSRALAEEKQARETYIAALQSFQNAIADRALAVHR